MHYAMIEANRNKGMLTIGIDSGTQSSKGIVLDVESGAVVAESQHSYQLVSGLPDGHLEQRPQDWVRALRLCIEGCLRELGDRKAEVLSIGVSGQQHGLVVLDECGEPVRDAKLWCDTSTVAQCEAFEAEFGGAAGLIEMA